MSFSLFLLNKKGLCVIDEITKNPLLLNLIDSVVIAKDAGNSEDCYEEIKQIAVENNINVFDRKEHFTIASEYILAIGWKWIINSTAKVFVIHDSLLPKYRGFSPLVNMLINGEEKIGATLILANEHFDEGDIIFQEAVKIDYPIKIERAIEVISKVYSQLSIKLFEVILNKEVIPTFPQNNNEATYSIWRDEEDYRIDWNKGAKEIQRFINAVGFPYGNAKSYLSGFEDLILIKEVEIIQDIKVEICHPGKVLKLVDGNPVVLCGKDALFIKTMTDNENKSIKINKIRSRFL